MLGLRHEGSDRHSTAARGSLGTTGQGGHL